MATGSSPSIAIVWIAKAHHTINTVTAVFNIKFAGDAILQGTPFLVEDSRSTVWDGISCRTLCKFQICIFDAQSRTFASQILRLPREWHRLPFYRW
jgi:hypothetical protein